MKAKILTGLSALLGLMMINGGLNKFFNYFPVPDDMPEAMKVDFAALTEIVWLMPLLGVAEIVGGILVIFPKTRALGALVLFPVVVGIVLTHVIVEPSGIPAAIAIAGVLGWIIADNWHKYLPIIK
jgi:uncharacterized membrane protein YphA (DoxX/SURF4 family)